MVFVVFVHIKGCVCLHMCDPFPPTPSLTSLPFLHVPPINRPRGPANHADIPHVSDAPLLPERWRSSQLMFWGLPGSSLWPGWPGPFLPRQEQQCLWHHGAFYRRAGQRWRPSEGSRYDPNPSPPIFHKFFLTRRQKPHSSSTPKPLHFPLSHPFYLV